VAGFDIGANDEPNGHGTVVCKWHKVNEALKGHEDKLAAKKLKAILELSNQTVGDAIANFLVIEAILRDLDMTIEEF
jgi:phosphoacetylglucosamine mutase